MTADSNCWSADTEVAHPFFDEPVDPEAIDSEAEGAGWPATSLGYTDSPPSPSGHTHAEAVAKGWVDLQSVPPGGPACAEAIKGVIEHLVTRHRLQPHGVYRAMRSWNARCPASWSRAEIEAQAVLVARSNPATLPAARVASESNAEPQAEDAPALRDFRPTLSTTGRNMTDLGNAERFAELFGSRLRYVADRGSWYVWCGSHWRVDRASEVEKAAAYTARQIANEATCLSNTKTSDSFGKIQKSPREFMATWGMRSEASERLKAMVHGARSQDPISCTAASFDRDPYALCTPDGVVHLRADPSVTPCSPEAMLTKCTRARFIPDARSQIWDDFVASIFQRDKDLAAYVQRAVGMSLIGEQRDHAFFFCWGSGSNGKSTFLNTVLHALGDYGAVLPPNLLIAKRNETHPTELADLEGRRMAVGAEVPQGATWDEVRIKSLTGGDNIKARRMHKDFFEFAPSHTFWMSGNSKPNIKGTDGGIWRRVRLIPFLATVKPDQMDRNLPGKLKQPANMAAILAWCVQGAEEYLRHGLGTCPAVESATQGYREDEDQFGQFLDECCEFHEMRTVEKGDLRKALKEWFEQRDLRVPTDKDVKAELERRGIAARQLHAGQRTWKGLGLRKCGSNGGRNWQDGDR